ncbi:MAG TPA: RsmE family RNA methyltransferase [Tissierellaceae bacterium]|nr:RsmE family RNA methyltransferase [Tissierellaceae bacterium]
MHRFFVEPDQVYNDHINILGQDIKHIKNVLRLKENDKIEIACEGINYYGEISSFEDDKVKVDIISKEEGVNEPNIDIVLYQGLAKGNRMDYIIQKGTEVGIKEFYIVDTKRTIVKIKNKKKEKSRINRLQSIGEEAAKQTKRDYIPKVNGILKFNDMVELLKDEKNILVPYENEEQLSIGQVLKDIKIRKNENKRINLIIGSEGGFEDKEINDLKNIGGDIFTLGNRILRTETAGVVASTIILYDLGNIGVI